MPTTDTPRFDRPLNEDERALMLTLAVQVIVYRLSCTENVAAAALDATDCSLKVSTTHADLYSNGYRIVHCARDWLAFHASFPGVPINLADHDDKADQ